ncbi:hypothetical protein DQ04_18141000, partial [Trypanosoma grayi]|uniref:hypothetical protein n=1 Tax=Trypanosoma grayi TaxID=71804 RepID=UPI0004F4322F
WKRRPSFCAPDTSRTSRWNGAFCRRRSVERWNWRISRSATVPGRQRRCACFTPGAAPAALGAFLLFFVVIVRLLLAVSLVRDMIACCCFRIRVLDSLRTSQQREEADEEAARRPAAGDSSNTAHQGKAG